MKFFNKQLLYKSLAALCCVAVAFSMVGFRKADDGFLRIGTWNVLHGNGVFDQQREFLKQLNLNAIALQEVDEGTERVNKLSTLRELGKFNYPFRYFGKAIDYQRGEYGLGYLSKTRLANVETTLIPSGSLEQQGIMRAELYFEKKKVSFYNVHFSFESDETRAKQIALAEALFTADPNPYKILAGDFNNRSLTELQPFVGYGIINSEENSYPTYQGLDWDTQAIDHIIYTQNLQLKNAEMVTTNLSDHNLLFADFKLLSENTPQRLPIPERATTSTNIDPYDWSKYDLERSAPDVRTDYSGEKEEK